MWNKEIADKTLANFGATHFIVHSDGSVFAVTENARFEVMDLEFSNEPDPQKQEEVLEAIEQAKKPSIIDRLLGL